MKINKIKVKSVVCPVACCRITIINFTSWLWVLQGFGHHNGNKIFLALLKLSLLTNSLRS